MGLNTAVAVAVLIPTSGEPITTLGTSVYCVPLEIISIVVTDPFEIVATAVESTATPGPVGESIVTVGAAVYPVPPEETTILSTS